MSNVTAIQPTSQFVPGQTVTLKSGGPVMTVRAIGGDLVICSWFNGNVELTEARFGTRELEAVKP